MGCQETNCILFGLPTLSINWAFNGLLNHSRTPCKGLFEEFVVHRFRVPFLLAVVRGISHNNGACDDFHALSGERGKDPRSLQEVDPLIVITRLSRQLAHSRHKCFVRQRWRVTTQVQSSAQRDVNSVYSVYSVTTL